MHLKKSSAKCRPFCLGLMWYNDVLHLYHANIRNIKMLIHLKIIFYHHFIIVYDMCVWTFNDIWVKTQRLSCRNMALIGKSRPFCESPSETHTQSGTYFDMLSSSGFFPVITQPVGITASSRTLGDTGRGGISGKTYFRIFCSTRVNFLSWCSIVCKRILIRRYVLWWIARWIIFQLVNIIVIKRCPRVKCSNLRSWRVRVPVGVRLGFISDWFRYVSTNCCLI